MTTTSPTHASPALAAREPTPRRHQMLAAFATATAAYTASLDDDQLTTVLDETTRHIQDHVTTLPHKKTP